MYLRGLLLSVYLGALSVGAEAVLELPSGAPLAALSKVNQPAPENSWERIRLEQSAVEIYSTNSTNKPHQVGSASWGIHQGKLYLFSADHVLQSSCKNADDSVSLKSVLWKENILLSCSLYLRSRLSSTFTSSVVSPVDLWMLPAEKILTEKQKSQILKIAFETTSRSLSATKSYSGLSFCRLSLEPRGEVSSWHFQGDYWAGFSENVVGCSGSALVIGGKLVGIKKGFSFAQRSSLYTPLTMEKLEPLTSTLDAGRGDPVDGGRNLSSSFVLLLPDLKSIPLMATAKRLMHVPEISTHEVEAQIDTQYESSSGISVMTCRGNLQYLSPKSTRVIHAEPSVAAPAWPMDSTFLSEAHEVQSRTKISRNSRGNYDFEHWPLSSQEPLYTSGRLVGGGWALKADQFYMELSPGRFLVQDSALGTKAVELLDPNICYRSVLLQNPKNSKVVLYNVELHFHQGRNSKDHFFEAVVWRAEAKSQQLLRQGQVESFEHFVLSRRGRPWNLEDLK